MKDSNLQQIYRTTNIRTKKNCLEDYHSQSSLCPYGCYITKENENLIIWNKTEQERCLEEAQAPPFPPFLDSVTQSDQPPSPPFGYSLDTENTEEIRSDISNSSNDNLSSFLRYRRFVSIHDFPEEGIDYDLEKESGREMVLMNYDDKTYIISPKQYQQLLLGYNRSFG